MKKNSIALSLLGSFNNQKNTDLLYTGDVHGFFKNRHSSHICFIDGEGGDSDDGDGDQSTDGDQGGDQGADQGKGTILGGDDGDSDDGDDKDKGGDSDDGDKDSEDDDKEKDKDQETGAPEKYEISIPEGMELDEEALEKFEPLFREMDMTNEQASKFAAAAQEHFGPMIQNAQQEIIDSMESQWIEQNKAWQKALYSDKEFGGKDAKENFNIAKSVIDRFGGEKQEIANIRKALSITGAGNHPEVMRLFYRVGKAMQEDTLGRGSDSGGKEEKNFFPNSPELK
ncbi:hypothetical protein ABKY54_004537 [Vibrio harveyi]